MTTLLHLTDSYLREFDATVLSVTEDGGLILDATAFYATGGGQPHDTGTLSGAKGSWQVVNVTKRGPEVQHVIAPGLQSPAIGTVLHGKIDWERRYRLM